MPLNPKQQRFVAEYLISLCATDAARKAGYAHPDVQGPRLLGNVRVRKVVDAELAKRAKRTELSQDWVIRRMRREATRQGEGSSPSARVRALELLGKHQGMFTDTVDVRVIPVQSIHGPDILGQRLAAPLPNGNGRH